MVPCTDSDLIISLHVCLFELSLQKCLSDLLQMSYAQAPARRVSLWQTSLGESEPLGLKQAEAAGRRARLGAR